MRSLKRKSDAIATGDDRGHQPATTTRTQAEANDRYRRRAYLRTKVRELLLKDDPLNINYGGGGDAYAPDINAIVARIGSCHCAEDLCAMIFEQLCRSFSPAAVGPREHYSKIARKLWQVYANE